MNIHDEPLTPEERVLAQRLARLGPHGEPSPALDARILAAAHAATTPARKRTPRWPVAFGIAASLALAVGIAWQLRPLPEATVYDEAASAASVQAESSGMTAESAADTAAQPKVELPSADFSKPPAAQVEARRARKVLQRGVPPVESAAAGTAAKAEPQAFPQPVAPPPEETAVVFDEPTPVAVPAPPAPPPASAATTAAPGLAAPAAARESHNAQGFARQKNVAADAAMDTFEADEEVVPPATADSPQVREAWLQRIRELAEAGKTDEARASLREFRHRYPAHTLPEDLRALAE
ncbi:hypothetical protein [Lysobacter sp. CFH 32150]|uniref:hypothetical protein n=1 Tax=Lysobacter sp. CFH 32150 TaxID=2927128 RepID=UPI00272CE508|nr:hypothetical protein [Lysobacter sp. CFH 32150]